MPASSSTPDRGPPIRRASVHPSAESIIQGAEWTGGAGGQHPRLLALPLVSHDR